MVVQSRTALVDLSGKEIFKENVSFNVIFWDRVGDDANSIALHMYYKFCFRVTRGSQESRILK